MAVTLWYVRSDSLGQDEKIGGRLVQSFFNSIGERLQDPADFFFINRGIFLTLDDSPVLDALHSGDPGTAPPVPGLRPRGKDRRRRRREGVRAAHARVGGVRRPGRSAVSARRQRHFPVRLPCR